MINTLIGKQIQKNRIEKEKSFNINYIKPLNKPLREIKNDKRKNI